MNIQNAQKIIDQISLDTSNYYRSMTERLYDGEFDASGDSQIISEHLDTIYDFLDYVWETRNALNDGGLPGKLGMDELVEFDSERAQKACDFMTDRSLNLVTALGAFV